MQLDESQESQCILCVGLGGTVVGIERVVMNSSCAERQLGWCSRKLFVFFFGCKFGPYVLQILVAIRTASVGIHLSCQCKWTRPRLPL